MRVKPATPLKECVFLGSSKRDIGEFPREVKADFGYALDIVQRGEEPLSAKALKGFGGRGILELVENHDGDTYRAVYTVKFAEIVYVLHCFQKKSTKGIATPQRELDLIWKRLQSAEVDYAITYREKGEIAMSEIEIHESSGNIFADLGLPDADEMLLKARLTAELRRLIVERKLTQVKAAKILSIGQGDLSKLLRGSLRGYTVSRLMSFLNAFDQDVEITVRPHPKAGEGGQTTLTLATA